MTVRSVLITGGNGNLGHLLADRFENTGIRVISYDIVEPQRPVPSRNIILGDIRDTDKLRTIFEKERPEAVVHLAGLLSGSSEADPMAAWEINATASVKLMQMQRRIMWDHSYFQALSPHMGRRYQQSFQQRRPNGHKTYTAQLKSRQNAWGIG